MNGDELEREIGAGEIKVRMTDLPMASKTMRQDETTEKRR